MLFADIEGSTVLIERLGDEYVGVLRDYHALMQESIDAHAGTRIDVAGDGVFASFPSARSAIAAAIQAQERLGQHSWPAGVALGVRMGIHTGEPLSAGAAYVGRDVHRAARICSAAHGGQVLVSTAARELIGPDMPAGARLRDLGEHHLKDIVRPEHLYQLVVEGLAAEFPPIRSLDTLPNNLPRQLSSFVGRPSEVEDLTGMIAATRLLSLIGPGGVGKTRLALEVAAGVVDSHRDGAWLVELGALTDESLVFPTIASVLNVKEEPGLALEEATCAALESRQLVLVLDNCEHVLDAAAQAVEMLLSACGELRIVATSREPLGIAGEHLYPVPPMSVPPPQARMAAAQAGESDAVALFVERARGVLPSFQLTDQNAAAVVAICHRLDGIPLALELAAARVRMLPPHDIAARLDDRFRLLTGGSRTALPRHRTLRATLDWSFDLLSAHEQTVLSRLSVFAGGFSVEAAEAVAAEAVATGSEGIELLDVLGRLVDRSLVVAEEFAGEGRYRLLETVRQYAQEKLLESGQSESAYRAHLAWCVRLVEQARPAFFQGPEAADWLERLDREHDNLRAAIAWSSGDASGGEVALRLAAGLWRYWSIRAHLAEGRGWFTQLLDRPGGTASQLRADTLTGAGSLAALQADHQAASALLEEALIIQRQLGDPGSIAYAANNLANVAIEFGALDRARSLYEEAVRMADAAGDRRGSALAIVNLADVAARGGDHAEADSLHEQAMSILSEVGDKWSSAYALCRAAQSLTQRGEPALGRERYARALAIYRELDDLRGVARTLQALGELEIDQGDAAAAMRSLRESLEIRAVLRDAAGGASVIERLARLSAGGDSHRAALLLGAAEALRTSIGVPAPAAERLERERLLESLGAAIGEGPMQEAWTAGQLMSLEAAATYVSEMASAEAGS